MPGRAPGKEAGVSSVAPWRVRPGEKGEDAPVMAECRFSSPQPRFQERWARLKNKTDIACPACKVRIALDTHQLKRTVAKIEADLRRLGAG